MIQEELYILDKMITFYEERMLSKEDELDENEHLILLEEIVLARSFLDVLSEFPDTNRHTLH